MLNTETQLGSEPQANTTTTDPSSAIRAQALKARSSRISVLLIRVGGSKPQVKRPWKQYQKRLYTNELEGDWTFLGDGIR